MPNNPFYRTAEWRGARASVLRVNPVCAIPGCGQRATDVDHVRSIRSGGDALDVRGLQALCHAHHAAKTARVDRPAYRRSDRRVTAHGCHADGAPRDPAHPWSGRG